MKHDHKTNSTMTERFGKDSTIALATVEAVMDILRAAFTAWYSNGHTNEAEPNTCLLKIRLTDGVLFADGACYDIEFGECA